MAPQPAFDPHTFLAKVGAGRTLVACPPQHPLFVQGDTADTGFYIQDGQAKLTVVSTRGKEAVIALLAPQACLAAGCLAGQLRRLPSPPCARGSKAEPAFATLFMASLLARHSRIDAALIDPLLQASEKRLARVLLLLAHFGTAGKTEVVLPQIRQATRAEMSGTTRSRVHFFLKKFRKVGVIDDTGNLRVHSTLRHVVLHDWTSLPRRRALQPLPRCLLHTGTASSPGFPLGSPRSGVASGVGLEPGVPREHWHRTDAMDIRVKTLRGGQSRRDYPAQP